MDERPTHPAVSAPDAGRIDGVGAAATLNADDGGKPVLRWAAVLDRLRIELLFLPLFLIAGIAFVALIPPGWNNDEPAHALRAEQIASGQLLPEALRDSQGNTAIGGFVPTDLVTLFRQTHAWQEGRVYDPAQKVQSLYADSDAVAAASPKTPAVVADFRNTAIYSPLAYLPALPAFWIGKLLSLSYFSTVILARVFDLLFVAAAVLFSIRIAPVAKWAFFVVALLPVFVSQAAGLSADPTVLASCMVFIAAVLRLIGAMAPPTARQYLALGLLAAAVPLTKVAYAPLLLLIVLVPLCRPSRSWRSVLGALGVVLAALVPAVLWTRAVGFANVSLNPNADFGDQLAFVLGHPVSYLGILYRTFVTGELDDLYSSLFGNFVWLSAPLSPLFLILAGATLLGAVLVRDDRESFDLVDAVGLRTFRYGTIAVVATTATVIVSAIYLSFSTLRAFVVEGFQGRYLVPLLPAVMAAVAGNVVVRQRPLKAAVLVGVVLVLIGGFIALYRRLY